MQSIIPDIHADINRLKTTLRTMGDGAPFAFLGDLIDAGSKVCFPDDRSVLQLVKEMMDAGDALGIMGNHELNAILFHRHDGAGRPLRKHSTKNTKQHKSFIEQFGVGTTESLKWTEWLLHKLPLWHDLGKVRLVHACWSDKDIAIVKERRPDGYLHVDDLEEIAAENTPFGQAVKKLVSGPEVELPSPYYFHDLGNNIRREVRIAWWRGDADTWRNIALSVPNIEELPDTPLPVLVQSDVYPNDQPPVFVGHYKMRGKPRLESTSALCLDYPATPCGYRWRGENALVSDNLIEIGAH